MSDRYRLLSKYRGDALSIAIAQTCPVAGDVTANVQDHLRLARIAASEGAQLLVFPELSLTGYELSVAGDLAFSEYDERVAPLIEVASAWSLTLIVGAPVRLGSTLHIGAFILYPDRKTELYTKHRLGAFAERASRDGVVPPAEATVFQPGDRNPLVRVAGGTAAIAICADAGEPAHAQQASDRGAQAYLVSMFAIRSEFDRDSAKLRRYAMRYSIPVALANYGCATGGLAAAGRSSIWAETGALLLQLNAGGSGVGIATRSSGGWRARHG